MLTIVPPRPSRRMIRGRVLHQEERGAHVHREHPVEQLGRGVEDCAPVGQRRRVDQAVDPAEQLVAATHHHLDLSQVVELGRDEHGLRTLPFQGEHAPPRRARRCGP